MRCFLAVLLLFCSVHFEARSQTAFIGNSTVNYGFSAPTSQAAGARRQQTIYRPTDFSIAPTAGLISRIYLRTHTSIPATLQLFQFSVRMGQRTDSVFSNNAFLPNLRTVRNARPVTPFIPVSAGSFVPIDLDTPFFYDGHSSLIVEVLTSGVSVGFEASGKAKFARRLFAASSSSSTGSIDSNVWDIGFDYTQLDSPNAQLIQALPASGTFALNSQFSPSLRFMNRSTDTLRTLRLNYQVNGGTIQSFFWSGSLAYLDQTSATFTIPVVVDGPDSLRIRYWIDLPNGGADADRSNDTLTIIYNRVFPGGTIVIGSGQTYNNLQAVLNSLASRGISGLTRLVLNQQQAVNSSSYPAIPGASATNQIIIEPADSIAELSINGVNAPAMTLNQVSAYRFERILFKFNTLPNNPHHLVRLLGATQIQFDSCRFDASNSYQDTIRAQDLLQILGGSSVTITNSTFISGRHGIFSFQSSTNRIANILIENNRFQNQLGSAMRLSHVNGLNIRRNIIEKRFAGSRSSICFVDSSLVFVIERNRFYGITNAPFLELRAFTNNPSSPINFTVNNIFQGRILNGSPAIHFFYTSGQSRLNYSFNSMDFDYSTGGPPQNGVVRFESVITSYGQYRNNILKVRRAFVADGGACEFHTISPQFSSIAMSNNYYDHDLPLHARGYNQFSSLTAFQASLVGQNANSHKITNAYSDTTCRPSNLFLLNGGFYLSEVPTDIDGVQRSSTLPDPGAVEIIPNIGPRIQHLQVGDTSTLDARPIDIVVGPNEVIQQLTLHYRRNGDPWSSVAAVQINPTLYRAMLDPRALLTRPRNNDTVYYYFTVVSQNTTVYLPYNHLIPSSPASFYRFRMVNLFAGEITVGAQNADFPTLRAAVNALANATVNDSITLVLKDNFYPQDTFPLIIRNSNFGINSKYIIRPADSVDVFLTHNMNSIQAMLQLSGLWNFELNGRSANGTGSLNLRSFNANNNQLIDISGWNNRFSTNIIIKHVNFIGNGTNELLTGIYQGGTTYGLLIQENNFRGIGIGINIIGSFTTGLVIRNNRIENTDSANSVMNAGISLSSLRTGIIEGNRIGPARFVGSGTTHGIYLNDVRNCVIRNNKLVGWENQFGANGSIRNLIGMKFIRSDSLTIVSNEIGGFKLKGSLSYGSKTAFNIEGCKNVLIANNSIAFAGSYPNFYQSILFVIADFANELTLENNILVNQVKNTSTTSTISRTLFFLFNSGVANAGLNLRRNALIYLNDISSQISQPVVWSQVNAQPQLVNSDFGNIYIPDSIFPFVSDRVFIPSSSWRPTFSQKGILRGSLVGTIHDQNGLLRPAFGDTLPDLGAYEFSNVVYRDTDAPHLDSSWSNLPTYNCENVNRELNFRLKDESGVAHVYLHLATSDTAEQVIPLILVNGDSLNGVWRHTLPSFSGSRKLRIRLSATDVLGNSFFPRYITSYRDETLKVVTIPDTLIPFGDSIYLGASGNQVNTLVFSELSTANFYMNRTTPLPSYFNNPNHRYVEISNYGSDTVDMSGMTFQVLNVGITPALAYIFPNRTLVPPGKVVIVTDGTTQARIDSLYFVLNNNNFQFPQFPGALRLIDRNNNTVDEVHISHPTVTQAFLYYNGISWTGNPIMRPNYLGFQLQGADVDWNGTFGEHNINNPGTLGYYQNELARTQRAQVNWTGPGVVNGNVSGFTFNPPQPGIFQFIVSASKGNCVSTDTVTIRVSGTRSTDFAEPVVSDATYTPGFVSSCGQISRSIQVRARERFFGSGVASVQLEVTAQNQTVQYLPFVLNSGNSQDGNYSINLTEPPAGEVYSLRVFAVDSNNNVSDTLNLLSLRSKQNSVRVFNDTTVSSGSVVNLRSTALNAARNGLHISEIIFNPTALGIQAASTWPAGVPYGNNGVEIVEITNFSTNYLHTDSIQLRFYLGGTNTFFYELPAVRLAPGEQLFVYTGPKLIAGNFPNVHATGVLPSANTWGASLGVTLFDRIGNRVISALATQTFTFPTSAQVSANVWTGTGIPVSSQVLIAGVHRLSLGNTAAAWRLVSATITTNLGSAPALTYRYPVQWRINQTIVGRGDQFSFSPTSNALVVAVSDTDFCTVRDTALVQVIGGTQAISAALTRVFTPGNGTNYPIVTPRFVVKNTGSVSIWNIPYGCRVGTMEYLDTLRSILNPGDSSVITFSRPINLTAANLSFCAFTRLIGDVNRSDDSICFQMGALGGPDFRPLSLASPTAGVNLPTTQVMVNYGNVGTLPAVNTPVFYQINGGPIISDTLRLSLSPSGSYLMVFSQNWTPPVGGIHQVKVWSAAEFELNRSNDTLLVEVGGQQQRDDIAVLSINSPSANVPVFQAVPVEVTLKNMGNARIDSVRMRYSGGATTVQETIFAGIEVDSSRLVTFSVPWLPDVQGILKFCVFNSLPNDLNATNDSVCVDINSIIHVNTTNKETFDLVIYPQPASEEVIFRSNKSFLNTQLEVISIQGKKVFETVWKEDTNELKIDVRKLANAAYFVKLSTPEGVVFRKMVVNR